MPSRPPTHRPAHARSVNDNKKDYDARRRKQKPWRALYKTTDWQRLRKLKLNQQPLCESCLQRGALTTATVVHHIRKHEGDPGLFFDPGNLSRVCKRCHDGPLQINERKS